MFVFHIITILFLATLFCNLFGLDWAREVLIKTIIKPDNLLIGLLIPVSLVISFVHIEIYGFKRINKNN